MTEQGCFVLKKGNNPPSVMSSVSLGVWRLMGVSSRGNGEWTCAVDWVVSRVRAHLLMDVGWGARWRMCSRNQGNSTNSVGVHSSIEEAGSTFGVPGIQVCAGLCANEVGIWVIHNVAA